MDKTFIQARIEATKALIILYEDALVALAHGVESYTLDTGQSRQIVTRFDIRDMNNMVDILYNRCATLEARLNGSGVVTARPAW